MPPEYCEFSVCFAEKCRAWLEKNHPELLAEGDITAQLSNVAVSSRKEEKADMKKPEEKKAVVADKRKKKPAVDDEDGDEDDDEDEDDDDDDDDDDGDSKPKPASSAAAAIRSKAPATLGVLIRKEQRSKHKYITSVKGMESFGCDLKKAAKAFSKKFACSASVVKVTEGGLEIQIQGDVQMELPDFIVQEFKSVDKTAIYFMDKANKKTRCF